MRRSVLKKSEEEEDINITPLLDIVFIMLIFFIVTSTFIKEPGIQVTREEAKTYADLKLVSVLVAIDADDQIWINKNKVDLAGVKQAVIELRRETPKGGAVLQADVDATNGVVIDVLQEIKEAGVDSVAISTKQG